jgi:geranyl-CoA carboxylase alpha subunit
VFAAGGATTAFIAQHQQALLAPDAALRARAGALAAVLLLETTAAPRPAGPPRRMTHSLPIGLRFLLAGESLVARLTQASRYRYAVEIGGVHTGVVLDEIDAQTARFTCEGLGERVVFHRDGASLLLHYRGQPLRVQDQTRTAATRQGEAGGDGKLRSSMNGRVVAVLAAVGDAVQAGQPLVTLEAMKMEHVHAAPRAGRLVALHVKMGDQVAAQRVVAEIEAVAEATA